MGEFAPGTKFNTAAIVYTKSTLELYDSLNEKPVASFQLKLSLA